MDAAGKSGKRTGDRSIKALYTLSAILAVVFVYMLVSGISYISSYIGAYGMTFSEMGMEAIKYVIDESMSYLVYALLLFSAGKIISMLSAGNEECEANGDEIAQKESLDSEIVANMLGDRKKTTTDLIKQRKKRRTIK